MFNILGIIPSIVTRCFKNRNKNSNSRIKKIRKKVKQAEDLIPTWYRERDRREVRKQVRRCLEIIDRGLNSNTWCKHTLMAEILHEIDMLEIILPQIKELKIKETKCNSKK